MTPDTLIPVCLGLALFCSWRWAVAARWTRYLTYELTTLERVAHDPQRTYVPGRRCYDDLRKHDGLRWRDLADLLQNKLLEQEVIQLREQWAMSQLLAPHLRAAGGGTPGAEDAHAR